MIDKMRKQYQRKFSKILKELNQAIAEDDLWLGRFEVRQIGVRWHRFSDNSGGILRCILRCIDKMTCQYKDYIIEYAPWMHTFHWHLSMDIMNKFIVDDLDVWKNGKPREEIKDWTKVKIPKKALEKTSRQWLAISLYQLCKY